MAIVVSLFFQIDGLGRPLDGLLEIDERAGEGLCVLVDPTIGDLLDGDRVEVMQLVATLTMRRDETCRLEHGEVFHHTEASHLWELLAENRHRQPIGRGQGIEQGATGVVGECLEHHIEIIRAFHRLR